MRMGSHRWKFGKAGAKLQMPAISASSVPTSPPPRPSLVPLGTCPEKCPACRKPVAGRVLRDNMGVTIREKYIHLDARKPCVIRRPTFADGLAIELHKKSGDTEKGFEQARDSVRAFYRRLAKIAIAYMARQPAPAKADDWRKTADRVDHSPPSGLQASARKKKRQ